MALQVNTYKIKVSEETTNVHYCSPTNSAKFTNCCGIAVSKNNIRCPECGKTIEWNLR